ncbi:MAG: ABC transporter permease, partial [Clostridiales bacterium]|nr:ABC transporter permease [Clostridiales bacterium]
GHPAYDAFYRGEIVSRKFYKQVWNEDTNEPEKIYVTCNNPDHWTQGGDGSHVCEDNDNAYIQAEVEREEISISNILYRLQGYNDPQNPNEPYTLAEAKAMLHEIQAFLTKYGLQNYMQFDGYAMKDSDNRLVTDVTVAGIFIADSDAFSDCAYMGENLYNNFRSNNTQQDRYWSETTTKYVESEDAFITALYIPFAARKSKSLVKELVSLAGVRQEDDSFVTIGNSLYESIDFVNGMVENMSKVFMILSIVLAAFSFLLMFNFISSSISSKKKEIGILRAIGSRTLDVFKIFLAEALIIALICFVIATVGSWGVCYILNGIMMAESAMFSTGLLLFGPVSVLIIAAIALVTSAIATTIPVALYSRKPPVASIRAL